ncbi:NepR family anti-sigma factor [Rhizorhapis sp. SPR117]|uniref:NepR family anti-sigma factor n=1 Tax=Rhizorhapis sp. SPR117 TaxID=2912611 RepID=UPI001F37E6B9|nr:hypothetical protein [Rhizorhapis sp. SPR117]
MSGNGQGDTGVGKRPETKASAGPGGVDGNVASGKRPALDDSTVGGALRSVYQQTVNEDIPAEMLDLLNKLS